MLDLQLDVEYIECSGPRYTSSAATRSRRKSKRVKKGGKPGSPSSFSAERLALFEQYQPEFNKLIKHSRTEQNKFWARLFKDYWEQFPYTVPLKEEPSDSTWPLPDEEVFTDEQREAKGKVVADVTAVCASIQTAATPN